MWHLRRHELVAEGDVPRSARRVGLQTKVWPVSTTGVIDQVQAIRTCTAYLGSVRRSTPRVPTSGSCSLRPLAHATQKPHSR